MSDNTINQCSMILAHMKKHGEITDNIARDYYGCKRLASRISDLRADGYPIATIRETGVNMFGKKVSWARYVMKVAE